MEPMFSAGEAYERFMGRWSRALAPRLVAFARVPDEGTLLDVGCGTGALTAAVLASRAKIQVVAIDASPAYVALARQRIPAERARVEVGDAQRLSLATASVGAALSLLTLNFVPDAHRAVAEMARVTRRGGTVSAAVWDYGDGMEMLRVFWDEAAAADPRASALDERRMPLCRKGELLSLWGQAGLSDLVEEPLSIETPFASFEDYWLPFLEKQGPAGAYVGSLERGRRERLEERLRARLAAETPRPIHLRARAWAVRGLVP